MTKRECAIVMAFTGIVMLADEDFIIYHKYVQEKMGRLVYTHELPELAERIKEASREDFLNLCRNAS